jgi:hypothetical protein
MIFDNYKPMNKRAVAPMIIILGILAVVVGIYIVLFIPIPAFTEFRRTINFYVIVLLWFLVQAGFIFLYFEMGMYMKKGFGFYKNTVMKLSLKVREFIITHV